MKIAAMISCTLGAKPFRNAEEVNEISLVSSQNFTDDVNMTSLSGAQERSFFTTVKLYQMTQLYMMWNGHPIQLLGMRSRYLILFENT